MRCLPHVSHIFVDVLVHILVHILVPGVPVHGIPMPSPLPTRPNKMLETFANPKRERDYVIRFDCPEFTCLCPKTGQPDLEALPVVVP